MDANIYREQIIDLYEHPLNYGEVTNPDFSYEEDNPLCGDVIRIDVRLDEQHRVKDVAWRGDGCAISQAAASLLTEEIKGKSLDEAMGIRNTQIAQELALPPVKIHCSILAEDAIKAAVDDYKRKHGQVHGASEAVKQAA